MPTASGVSSTGSTTGSSQTGAISKPMDRDAFLKLLVTQLQNQDPMNPMQDKDFIAQLAQFSSLEQMMNMSKGFEDLGKSAIATQALSLIGQAVDYHDWHGSGVVTGVVESASFGSGGPKLKIGAEWVDLGDILIAYGWPKTGSGSEITDGSQNTEQDDGPAQ